MDNFIIFVSTGIGVFAGYFFGPVIERFIRKLISNGKVR